MWRVIAFALLLTACGSDNDTTLASSKSLFNTWTAADDGGATVWSEAQITLAAFGTGQTTNIILADLSNHSCTLDLTGTTGSGTYALSACSPAIPTFTSESGTYSVSGATLQLCPTSGTCRNHY